MNCAKSHASDSEVLHGQHVATAGPTFPVQKARNNMNPCFQSAQPQYKPL